MIKKMATVKWLISSPFNFVDTEDLAQQIEDARLELESLGFEIDSVKWLREDAADDEEEEPYDEDL